MKKQYIVNRLSGKNLMLEISKICGHIRASKPSMFHYYTKLSKTEKEEFEESKAEECFRLSLDNLNLGESYKRYSGLFKKVFKKSFMDELKILYGYHEREKHHKKHRHLHHYHSEDD